MHQESITITAAMVDMEVAMEVDMEVDMDIKNILLLQVRSCFVASNKSRICNTDSNDSNQYSMLLCAYL